MRMRNAVRLCDMMTGLICYNARYKALNHEIHHWQTDLTLSPLPKPSASKKPKLSHPTTTSTTSTTASSSKPKPTKSKSTKASSSSNGGMGSVASGSGIMAGAGKGQAKEKEKDGEKKVGAGCKLCHANDCLRCRAHMLIAACECFNPSYVVIFLDFVVWHEQIPSIALSSQSWK